MALEQYIRDIVDFPKPGIIFKDITPLLASPKGTEECLQLLINRLKEKQIDKVIGVESRGFFFATLLAHHFKAGFIPVRKPKKLPFETISASYELEYGTDTLEMHIDAIQPGDKVLIHGSSGGVGHFATQIARYLGCYVIGTSSEKNKDFFFGINDEDTQNQKHAQNVGRTNGFRKMQGSFHIKK